MTEENKNTSQNEQAEQEKVKPSVTEEVEASSVDEQEERYETVAEPIQTQEEMKSTQSSDTAKEVFDMAKKFSISQWLLVGIAIVGVLFTIAGIRFLNLIRTAGEFTDEVDGIWKVVIVGIIILALGLGMIIPSGLVLAKKGKEKLGAIASSIASITGIVSIITVLIANAKLSEAVSSTISDFGLGSSGDKVTIGKALSVANKGLKEFKNSDWNFFGDYMITAEKFISSGRFIWGVLVWGGILALILGLAYLFVGDNKAQTVAMLNSLRDKLKKMPKTAVVGAAAAIVAIGVGTYFWTHRALSIVDEVQVSFSGYNGYGTADYNTEQARQSVIDRVGDKKAETIGGTYTIELSDYSGLKNGQKIKIKVTNNDKKHSPVKTESKTVTVKGLAKTTTYTIDDYLRNYDITFSGMNGSGTVVSDGDGINASSKNNGSLSNGDEVIVEIPEYVIQDKSAEGKFLKGDASKTIKVEGLKGMTELSGFDEVEKQMDLEVQTELRDDAYDPWGDSYTGERVKTFVGKASSYWSDYDNMVELYGIYKIHYVRPKGEYNEAEDKTYYVIWTTSDLGVENGSVDVEDDFSVSDGYKEYKTLQEAIDGLKTDHAKAVELS
jgi:hypothetical protein